MDQKEFERLEMAVQYVVDDDRRQKAGERSIAHVWDQGTWGRGTVTAEHVKAKNTSGQYAVVCPTSGCLAGTIVTQAGDHMIAPLGQKVGNEIVTDYCIDAKGVLHSIEERGMSLIGGETAGLFGPGLEVDSIVRIATGLAAGWGFQLEVV